jgi:nicotinamide-nucleotide amidase
MNPGDLPLANPLATAKAVITTLSNRDCMLGVSESVTGGTIASCLTRVDGCSKVLFASQVLYSILGKASFCELTVKKIAENGTVSEYIIMMMLDSMARRFLKARSDIGLPDSAFAPRHFMSLATCGVAGDSIEGLPRGTVLAGISLHREDGTCIEREIRRYQFEGDRGEIIVAASRTALALVLEKAALLKQT